MGRQALILVVAVSAIAGCGSGAPQATDEQTKAFEGGPMPKEWQDRMSKSQSSGQQRGAESGK